TAPSRVTSTSNSKRHCRTPRVAPVAVGSAPSTERPVRVAARDRARCLAEEAAEACFGGLPRLYLVRPLGEGGKDVAYLAQHEAPLRRRVALNPIQRNWREFGGAVR